MKKTERSLSVRSRLPSTADQKYRIASDDRKRTERSVLFSASALISF
jgi:hypothetical protein